MSNKTFDRSNSFTFFKNFRDSVDGYGAAFGEDIKLSMYEAIIDYGLYQKIPEDKQIQALLTPMMYGIDHSQEQRASGFKGGRPKTITASQAEVIRQMQREGKSIRDISAHLHIPSSTLSDFLRNDRDSGKGDDKENYTAENDVIYKDTNEVNYDKNCTDNDTVKNKDKDDSEYNGMVFGQFSDTCNGYEDIGQHCDIPGTDYDDDLPF